MKQIPFPQNPSNKAWNSAVHKINEDTQAQYGLVDTALDMIEQKKDTVRQAITELEEQKAYTRVWMDFLSELIRSY